MHLFVIHQRHRSSTAYNYMKKFSYTTSSIYRIEEKSQMISKEYQNISYIKIIQVIESW